MIFAFEQTKLSPSSNLWGLRMEIIDDSFTKILPKQEHYHQFLWVETRCNSFFTALDFLESSYLNLKFLNSLMQKNGLYLTPILFTYI